jgi:hypothetical protein
MYIAYMIQWWVFAVVMPVTWVLLIRREAGDRAQAEQEARKAEEAEAPQAEAQAETETLKA